MSDINPLGASVYYGGLQNATSQAAKDAKKEKVNSAKKIKFSELLKSKSQASESASFAELQGFPPEIADLSIEDAAVFLKDRLDLAGNKISESATTENILEFKTSVQQFIKFVILNNYEINSKPRRGFSQPMQFFSNYNTQRRPKDPRITVSTINEKLDKMTRAMLLEHKNNLELLAQVNEIKGLIVDLMQA